jgi:hypothetical protein
VLIARVLANGGVVFATFVIALLSVPVGDAQPGNGAFCLRSTDAVGGQVCFPMQQAEPPSAEAQAKLRAELQRRAADAIERLKTEQRNARPEP